MDWLPKGSTASADRRGETLERLRSSIKAKRPSKLSLVITLLHNNVRPSSASTTREKLQQFGGKYFHIPPTFHTRPRVTIMLHIIKIRQGVWLPHMSKVFISAKEV